MSWVCNWNCFSCLICCTVYDWVFISSKSKWNVLFPCFVVMLNTSKKRKQRRDRMCLQDFIYWVISHINPLTAAINITDTLCCIFMQYILYILKKSQWYTGINIHFCTVGKNQGWKTKATAIFLAQSATDDLMLWWSVYRASTHSFTPPGMIGFWWKFQTVTWWIFIKSLPKVKVMFSILCEL